LTVSVNQSSSNVRNGLIAACYRKPRAAAKSKWLLFQNGSSLP
jgi:hypothetical protein